MLEIKNVHKTFNKGTINEKKALNGVNLHLDPGDFVTIIGGNGAGKSTTLNMVAGVYPIDQRNDHSRWQGYLRSSRIQTCLHVRKSISGPNDGNGSRYAD